MINDYDMYFLRGQIQIFLVRRLPISKYYFKICQVYAFIHINLYKQNGENNRNFIVDQGSWDVLV